MDGFINSSIEKQTIYEIYRACRLCGAGAGYKMPIMQNVVHLDRAEVELRQKIRECVQIEVHQEDKMPPLICELCVDKVNDFYEFLEMCRQTNKRTRLRLGLPPQTMPRGAPDAGDCILGVTEPVYLNEDSNESLLKPRARNKGRFTKVSENTKKTNAKQNEVRSLRSKHVSPPPQRASKRIREDDISLSKLKKTSTRQSVTVPKSILRKENEVKVEDEWSPTRSKRSRDSRDTKPETMKRVKIVEKPSPKSDFQCKTCKAQYNNNKALNNHMRTHNKPQPKYKSTPKQEKKNSCSKCKKDFPTKLSLDKHKCAKTSASKCGNCGKHIPNVRNLANHERSCQSKKEFKISPHLLKKLRPIQIRVKRCDPLLKKIGECYDVSGVDCNFGLDKNSFYPYLTSIRIKTEPSYMVNIHDTIDDFDFNSDYVHWDSDSHESDTELSDIREKNVGSLANLSLRTIFSHKFLGKVPKRKRTAKPDKAYDSILNFDSDVRLGIGNIINSLDNDNDRSVNDTKDNDNDSLFGDKKTPGVSNDDFDSLFCSNNDSESSLKDISKTDDEKREIVHKNNETENENSEEEKSHNINDINNDNSSQLDCNDTLKSTQEKDKSESSEIVPGIISDVNNDKVLKSAQNSIIPETVHKEEDGFINNKTIKDIELKENEEIILKNNDNIDKVTNDKESSNSINYKETEIVIENDDSVIGDETEKSSVNINDTDHESNIPVNERNVSDKPPNTKLIGVDDDANNDSLAHDNDNKINDTPLNETVASNDNKMDDTLLNETLASNDNKIDDTPLNETVASNDNKIDDTPLNETVASNDNKIDDTPLNETVASNDNKIYDTPLNETVASNDNKIDDTPLNETVASNDNKINDTLLNETVTKNDDKLNKACHVNGDDKLDFDDLEDISDSEMDDSRLMDAIDEQIGEKRTEDKSQEDERDSVSVVNSADLESISSEDIPNE